MNQFFRLVNGNECLSLLAHHIHIMYLFCYFMRIRYMPTLILASLVIIIIINMLYAIIGNPGIHHI